MKTIVVSLSRAKNALAHRKESLKGDAASFENEECTQCEERADTVDDEKNRNIDIGRSRSTDKLRSCGEDHEVEKDETKTMVYSVFADVHLRLYTF